MKASTSKERILKKIRQALSTPVPVPFPQSEGGDSVYQPQPDDLAVTFAENFSKLQGRFAFCLNMQECVAQLEALAATRHWKNIYCRETLLNDALKAASLQFSGNLHDCDASITGCEFLIARTGSMMLSAAQESGRTVSVYAPVHICIAYADQLVYDIKDAVQKVKEKYPDQLPSLITLATGPSRTADIEKTLVVGVHGPKEVFCFLIEK